MWFRVLAGQLAQTLLTLVAMSLATGMTVGCWADIVLEIWIILALAVIVAIPLTFWVLAPGRALVEAIQQVQRGDVERLAAHRGPTGLRDIVGCVNDMATTLQGNAFFLADISHQLRTELQLLQTRLERLSRHVGPSGTEIHAQTMTDVERLHGTLTEHLELANLIEFSPPMEVHVCGVVLERVPAWSDVAARRNVSIELLLRGNPVILSRQGVLEELLDILLDNAVKYSPRSGVITVEARCGKRDTTLRVLDQGPGMTAEERERARERGWRGDRTRGEGRGLGLSIASMLVGSNGGRLTLEAGPGGRGTDARCVFPVLRRQADR